MSLTELTRIRRTLARAFSSEDVNQLGRDTGQAKRLRTVTPHRLLRAVVSALASSHVESLADLLRTFNDQNGVQVAYKAFYNRLARVGFEAFMRGMCTRLIEHLRVQTLAPDGERAVARLTDIVIQDGSSFAVKQSLRAAFPGRFTTVEPAAVEVHATYSGFADEVRAMHVAPDCEAERQFLPDPAALQGRLWLADRGYPSVPYFDAVRAHGGAFIVRLSRSHHPHVRAARVDGHRVALRPGIRVSRFLAQPASRHADMDIEYVHRGSVLGFRLGGVPGRDQTMSRLCTNLSRTPFSASVIARLYRFRWQIEFCFKEWKSYGNLHKFDTGNPHIAAELIWASLCAAILKRFLAHAAQRVGHGTAMSTHRVAMCAHHILGELVRALLAGEGLLVALRRGLADLLANARRANIPREYRTGRLRSGLVIVGDAYVITYRAALAVCRGAPHPGGAHHARSQTVIPAFARLGHGRRHRTQQDSLLRVWGESGKTVVMVTHDVDEALYLVDRLIPMTDGSEAIVGDTLRVPFPRPRSRAAVLGHHEYHACRRHVMDFLEHHAHQSRPSALDTLLHR